MMVSFPIDGYSKKFIFNEDLSSLNSLTYMGVIISGFTAYEFIIHIDYKCYVALKAKPKQFESKEHFPFHFLYTRGDTC